MDPNPTTSLSLLPKVSSSSFFFYGLSLKCAFLKTIVQACLSYCYDFQSTCSLSITFFTLQFRLLKIPSYLTCRVPHSLDFGDYSLRVQLQFLGPLYFLEIDSHIQSTGYIVLFVFFVFGKTVGGIMFFHQEAHNVQLSFFVMLVAVDHSTVQTHQIIQGNTKQRQSCSITCFSFVGWNAFPHLLFAQKWYSLPIFKIMSWLPFIL